MFNEGVCIMSAKKNIRNIFISFLTVFLFDVIYSVLGLLIINNISIKPVSAIIVILLLCGLLIAGYFIGAKLFSAEKMNVVSIVIVPMVLSLLIFGLGIIAVPVISMVMQYPGIILTESLGIDKLFGKDSAAIYIIVVLFQLLCCLSLLFGSFHKKQVQ